MKKIIVTGRNGFVARHLIPLLTDNGFEVIALGHAEMDICDAEQVQEVIASHNPDWVVHCAAISSTAVCKEQPELSMAVNVKGTENIARACMECGARLVYCSSDQVYSGCTVEGALGEELPLTPNNPYGAHKLLMEERVQALMPEAIGLRLTWMYDADKEHLHGVTKNLHEMLVSQSTMKACTREHRGLTDINCVTANIMEIIVRDIQGGVYNFGAPNELTTHETLCRALQEAHLVDDASTIVIADDSWSRNLAMDISKLESQGIHFDNTLEMLVGNL